jgi:hypothetical protein
MHAAAKNAIRMTVATRREILYPPLLITLLGWINEHIFKLGGFIDISGVNTVCVTKNLLK